MPDAKRAIITGASSGIGKATAIAFAKAGIDVALISRSASNLAVVADAAIKAGVKAKAYPIDLAQVKSVKSQISTIAAEFGPIDILVNSAGMAYTGAIADIPLADWQHSLDLNLTSVFQCIQGVLPQMRDRKQGIIINIASIAGIQTFPDWGAYCVSKFGLMALSQTLATEERGRGIKVTAICLGSVNTPLWDTETVDADFDRQAMLTPEVVAQSILHVTTLPATAEISQLNLMPHAGVF